MVTQTGPVPPLPRSAIDTQQLRPICPEMIEDMSNDGVVYVETRFAPVFHTESGLHWDLVCDLRTEGEVYADGELVWRAGRFLESAAPARV